MESGCSADSPECFCPCGCGSQNDPNGMNLPFTNKLGGTILVPTGEVGICASCAEGSHEVPPESVISVSNLIALHDSVLAQLRRVRKERS